MIVNKYINGGGGGSGERGPQGYQGPEGPQGPQGAQGADGLDGKDGKDGADGKDGLDGQTGPQGAEGAQGPQGVEGQVGPQGPQGPAGSGGTGDNFILKSSSGTPENLGSGDVYAYHEDATTEAVYGNDWDDTGYQTLTFQDVIGYHPQAIRIEYTDWVYFDFGFNCENWHDGFGFNIDGGTFNVADYDTSRWEVSSTHIKFIAEDWMNVTGGKTLYLDIVDEYLYIYTDGTDKIWLNDVAQNMMNNVYVGEVIPAHDAIDKVYQVNINYAPNVQIELEGNARVDGTLDNPTQIVTMSDGKMKVSFYDPSDWQYDVCYLESYNNYFRLFYEGSVDAWTLYDSDGENTLIKLGDGESDSADFGDGYVYLSYSGGVLEAYTDYEKGWKNWDMGDSHGVVLTNELAKISDLPKEKQLVPNFDKDNWNYKVLTVDTWNSIGTSWRDDTEVLRHALQNMEGFNNGEKGKVLTVKDYWGIEWQQPDMVTTEAVEELPVGTKDGNMFAVANASGYGIYQAQSAHTGYGWFNLEGKTIPQGSITKVRVPYDDTAESNIVHIKTDPNGSGEMNLYWHPENPYNKYWDIGDPNGMNQYRDEFSLTDYWGNSVVAVKVGNYIEVTFGAPIYQGDDTISTYRNTEVYTEGSIADYRRVAFYDEIGGGGSGSQGPQGPQGETGAQGPQGETGAQGPQGPAGSGGGGSSYISDLQSLGINILEGQGVGFADDPQTPTQYTTIEPQSDGSAYVCNYTDDGQDGWMQSESFILPRSEDIWNAQNDVLANGLFDGDNILKLDPDYDGATQVGTYEPGEYDEPTFTRQRYLVGSTNIKRMVKITEGDYDTLVNNGEVDEDTFYIVVANGPDYNEP